MGSTGDADVLVTDLALEGGELGLDDGFVGVGVRDGSVIGEAEEFAGVEFEGVGLFGEFEDQRDVIVGWTEVHIEDAEPVFLREEFLEHGAVGFMAQGEGAEDEGGAFCGGGLDGFGVGQFIPSGRVGEGVGGVAGGVEFGIDGAGGEFVVYMDEVIGKVTGADAFEGLRAEPIVAEGGEHEGIVTELLEMVGDVEGRAAQEQSVREAVPEDFAEAEDGAHVTGKVLTTDGHR